MKARRGRRRAGSYGVAMMRGRDAASCVVQLVECSCKTAPYGRHAVAPGAITAIRALPRHGERLRAHPSLPRLRIPGWLPTLKEEGLR